MVITDKEIDSVINRLNSESIGRNDIPGTINGIFIGTLL